MNARWLGLAAASVAIAAGACGGVSRPAQEPASMAGAPGSDEQRPPLAPNDPASAWSAGSVGVTARMAPADGADLIIDTEVHRAIRNDPTLSAAAKDVKITTLGRKVTLRGSVETLQERAAVEAHARGVAGVADVDDEVVVAR